MKAPTDAQVLDDVPARASGDVACREARSASGRPPFLAALALGVADAVLALAIVGPLLANLDSVRPFAGLLRFALCALLALLGLLLGALALRAGRGGRPGGASAPSVLGPRARRGVRPLRRSWT
jgi:hypothetical protein